MPYKKILLISQVFYPDEVAVANLFTNLCVVLVKTGEIDIEVWCSHPSYTNNRRQQNHREYKGISIYYLASTNFPKYKILGRAVNFFTFSLSVICKMLFSTEKSIVISHTTPPLLAVLISFICRIKKRRNLIILMDIFPDGLIRLNKVSQNNLFIRIWQRLNVSAFKQSYRIVVIGRDMMEWILRIYPEGIKNVVYIPLWQDDKLIKPIYFAENPFIIENRLQDSFVVQYSGNMGLWNEMKTIGQAVNRNLKGVIFLFIGGGMRRDELLNSFENPVPENVLHFPFVPNETYSYTVSACHVSLVSVRCGLEGMAVPSKIIGIMAAGIPVIALVPFNSEIAYIVREDNCGIVIDPDDTDSLIDAILKLKKDEKLRSTLGANGRSAYEKKYTTDLIAKRYMDLINEEE
jgi:colanic acid biosynthesis glycosyl transferase WcaI